MKKTKILSIFSHPSTLKSMPILRTAVFRLLQSVPSHCPCLSQGLGSAQATEEQKKAFTLRLAGDQSDFTAPQGSDQQPNVPSSLYLSSVLPPCETQKKCQSTSTFKSRFLTILEFCLFARYLFTDQSQTSIILSKSLCVGLYGLLE